MRSSKLASAPSNARPVVLQLLDQLAQLARVDALELVAQLAGPDLGVRLAAELAHDEAARRCRPRPGPRAGSCARPWRRPRRGRRPCGRTRTGRRTAGSRSGADVGDLGDRAAELRERRQVAAAGRDELGRRLEREVGEDRDHVRVAAPLAVAVDRGLDVADAGLDRRDRVRDRELGVVVGVDAPDDVRRAGVALERAADVAQDPHQLVGQRAAVRVAQDERPGAGLARGPQRGRARSRGPPCSRRRSAPRRTRPRGRDPR